MERIKQNITISDLEYDSEQDEDFGKHLETKKNKNSRKRNATQTDAYIMIIVHCVSYLAQNKIQTFQRTR